MPSPIGHALGGLIAGLLLSPRSAKPRLYPTHQTYLTAAVIAACAPDLDFLWGRHNRETHSVIVAIVVAAGVWVVTRRSRLALVCGIAWASHVLFDWLGSDDSPPLGVMALWPLNSHFYFANAYVFEAISRRYAEPGFWQQNVWALTKELLMLLPPAVLLWWWRRRETRRP